MALQPEFRGHLEMVKDIGTHSVYQLQAISNQSRLKHHPLLNQLSNTMKLILTFQIKGSSSNVASGGGEVAFTFYFCYRT